MAEAYKVDWRGSFAVIVTPFTETGRLDEPAFRKVIDLIIADGCHGVIVAGSTGEFYVLTHEERKQVFRIAVEQAAGRIPVLGGCSAIATDDVIELGKYGADVGLSGTMILPPYYAMPNEREIVEHYRRIATAVPLPMMLYNGPGRTGINLLPKLVARLTEFDNVAAIKDSSRNIEQFGELVRLVGDRLRLFIGLETMLLAAIVMGGHGVVAMAPQVVGRLAVDLYEASAAGDIPRARDLQIKMSRFYDVFKLGSGYVGLKEAMNMLGRPGGFPRPPLLPLTEAQRAELRTILTDLKLLPASVA